MSYVKAIVDFKVEKFRIDSRNLKMNTNVDFIVFRKNIKAIIISVHAFASENLSGSVNITAKSNHFAVK